MILTLLYFIYQMLKFDTPHLLSLFHVGIYFKYCLSYIFSLSLDVLTLFYFTPYKLAPIFVSKSGGAGEFYL